MSSRTTRTSAVRTVERGIRCAIVAVLAVGLRRRDPGAVVNAVLSLAATYLPDAVERRYDVRFRPWQRVYVASAMVTHAAGMLGPYDDVGWWDHLTHAHSATLLGGVVHVVARRRGRDPARPVVGSVALAGVAWEVVEYGTHRLADALGIEPVLVSYGKTDTVLDLVFDLVGALLVVLFGDRLLGNFVGRDE